MSNLFGLNIQFTVLNDALDKLADRIADVKDDLQVKAALVKQYEEIKKQKLKIKSKNWNNKKY
jgi:uncharacterized protein YdcH (DUF465 family)